MFLKKNILLNAISLIFLAFSANLLSNEPFKKYETGIFYGAVSSQNNFTGLGETPNCCPEEYDTGSGFALILPINYYHRIYEKTYLIIGLNYQFEDLVFNYLETEPTENGDATVKHFLNSRRNSLGLNTGLSYDINKIHLNALLSSNYVLSSDYDQRESLISAGAFDSLGTRTRNVLNSQESTLSTSFNLRLLTSFSYSVRFKKNYEFLPSIGLQFDLLSLHKENQWRNTGIYFGLMFRYLILHDNTSPINPNR